MQQILFQDEQLVAVHKPAGLLVHRSPIDRHETRFALQMVRDLIGERVFPAHRLDKPTSGVLLFARSPDIANRLMSAFAAGEVTKRYLAIVRGVPALEGTIDHPLLEETDRLENRPETLCRTPQQAVTRYRRLAEIEIPAAVSRYPSSRYALVELQPQTGRRRQLRRHLKHIHHPIIGDTTYGDGRHNRFFRQQFDCSRLLLHAVQLEFPHPVTGVRTVISAPLDAEFARLMQLLGWGSDILKLHYGGCND